MGENSAIEWTHHTFVSSPTRTTWRASIAGTSAPSAATSTTTTWATPPSTTMMSRPRARCATTNEAGAAANCPSYRETSEAAMPRRR